MSVTTILFSKSDGMVVFDEDPLPNRVYPVGVLNDAGKVIPNLKYELRMVGSNLSIFDRRGSIQFQMQASSMNLKRTRTEIDQTDAIGDWLDSRCPDLSRLDDMFDIDGNPASRSLTVKGHVQSGKTSFMVCSAMKYMFGPNSMSSIIVLRDSVGDYVQINSRIKEMKQDMSTHLRIQNVVDNVDFATLDDKVDAAQFKHAMSGMNPKIFVVLGNNVQLKKLNDLLKKTVGVKKFAVFIDEADSNDTGTSGRKDEMDKLKAAALRTFYISATILDLELRDSVEKKDVFLLQENPNYMGIEKIAHRLLPLPALASNRVEDDPLENDPNLEDFVVRFSKLEPHDVGILSLKHPQICLMTCGCVTKPQQRIFCASADYDVTVILYNGDGIELFDRSLIDEEIVIKNDCDRMISSSECDWCEGAHSFSNAVSIAGVVQWLKDNGGVDRFPRIIIISGKLAGRGISFTSADYGKYLREFESGIAPSWMGWRLTSMYYVPSATTSQPNLIQSIGRLCCVVRDDIQTCLYANDDVFSDLRKAYWTQEELIARAKEVQDQSENPDETRIGDEMKKLKMKKAKLSKRPLTVGTVKRLSSEQMVDGDDGGFDMDETYDKEVEDQSAFEWQYEVPADFDEEDAGMSKGEFFRLTTRMFPAWAVDDSRIALFMQDLDPNKLYNKTEMTELCMNNRIKLSDVTDDPTRGWNKHGKLIQIVGGKKYRLYPVLVDAYEKSF